MDGKNSVTGSEVREIIDRLERIAEQKKQLNEDAGLILAEAKARGFNTKTIKKVLKIRTQKPQDVEEDEAMLDLYLTAIGMKTEAPLFRQVGLMAVDTTAKESVIEAFKQLVPAGGEIIVKMGGQPVRLWRSEDGTAHAADVVDPPPAPARRGGSAPSAPQKDFPQVTAEEAEALGEEAARGNQPVISNPFPWDHPNRSRWDLGWRRGAGSDGMGPEDE